MNKLKINSFINDLPEPTEASNKAGHLYLKADRAKWIAKELSNLIKRSET